MCVGVNWTNAAAGTYCTFFFGLHSLAMPTFSMLDRVWELRHNLTAYDAAYVALAETLQCPLVTGDARISRASGLRCPVTVLPG
jgi:predicted nucleic acid-binding protein